MRTIEQPGPAPTERIQWVEARGQHVNVALEPGLRLLDAVQKVFATHGLASGVLRLTGGAFGPFAYVMPTPSDTSRHVAFYGATHRPSGSTRVQTGALTFGLRDGAPFFHCHALWTEADGKSGGGHVLPEDTFIADPIRVDGIGLDGVAFEVEPDAETNFAVLGPTVQNNAGSRAHRRVFALRMRPNQDVCRALEVFCQDRGIAAAHIHGGVGSIIGARFADGRTVEAFATELAVQSGAIAPSSGGELEAKLDVALVDHLGVISEGQLARGDNPVLITMELVLETL